MTETTPTPLDPERVKSIVRGYYDAADSLVSNELGPIRAMMGRYYHGEPFGNEEEGRSQVVSTDVRDTIAAIMPSLMRVFFGPEKVVEFAPRTAEDVPQAEQATDYVDYIVREVNPGFLEFYSWFKDALIRKVGVMKVWWEDKRNVTEEAVTGLDPESVSILQQEVEATPDVRLDLFQEADGTISGRIVRTKGSARPRFKCVPPEEFLIHPDASSLEEARYCAHRSYTTVGDLVALGYDYEEVRARADSSVADTEFGEETDARKSYIGSSYLDPGDGEDPTSLPVLYVEHIVRMDGDGDGVPELHKICTIGQEMAVVADEVVEDNPFVMICPDPEPHEFFGMSIAEVVADIQLIKSAILRSILDSLAQTVIPRTGVVEGKVNIADVLNNEVGGIIRMEAPGMVTPFNTPFVGKDAFPVVSYLDEVKENRTGISKAAAGLDPDALQSSTKAAVAATITAANQHIELIARIFAELGVKHLYRKVLHIVAQHQKEPRMLNLRGKWTAISPSAWAIDRDVKVLIGVGEGTTDQRVQVLLGLAGKMEGLFANLGPSNPLVKLSNYREVLKRILELNGFSDVDRYLQPIDPQQEVQMEAQQKQNAEAQAANMLAQVQVEQIKADISMKQAELELKREEMGLKHQQQLAQMRQDYDLRLAEMNMRYQQSTDVALIQAQADETANETPEVM